MTRFDKPAAEPTIEMVDDATAALVASGATAVVALGGGSVIDTAKAARLCAQLGLHVPEFLAARPGYPVPEVALVAMPTSAGTGSEVSGGSVVSDPEAGRKNGIANANLRAQVALVDPLLTHSMPPAMTANTGIDALAQAIAAVVAKVRTPIGDAIALEAVRMMTPALVAAYRDGTDAAARSAMSCGSMMAGLAMNISDCTAEHSLGQAIGGVTHVPHGLTIGLVLAETLERERAHVPELLERVADAMGEPDDGSGDGSRAVRAVRRILAELDFPVLSSLGHHRGRPRRPGRPGPGRLLHHHVARRRGRRTRWWGRSPRPWPSRPGRPERRTDDGAPCPKDCPRARSARRSPTTTPTPWPTATRPGTATATATTTPAPPGG